MHSKLGIYFLTLSLFLSSIVYYATAYGQTDVMQSRIQRYSTASPWGSSPQQILQNVIDKNNINPSIVNSIQLSNQNVLNAWTDGQNIYVTRLLWSHLTNNDERAFIISHELSHVILHHILQTEVRRTGLSLIDRYIVPRFAQPGTLLNMASSVGLGLIDKKYSRSEEYQADDYGIQLLTHAGYNPNGAMQVFKMLEQSAGASSMPEFLQDHPITEDRIKALVTKYRLKE